ncbi:MAG: hypothetical protein HRO68_06770 [Nitrosopumilus sp.]|nr:hypothetical protein [Nitrosopumilus sp.]
MLRILFVFFTSFVLIGFSLDDVFADEQEITSRIFSFETTSIIEFTNNGLEEIKTIRIWLIDSSFISFKLENNWTSPIASLDTIIFTTSEPIKTNEIVKLGIKTEKSNLLIHWEVYDQEDNSIEVGKTPSEIMQSFVSEPEVIIEPVGILPESTFKVVPKNLHPGSTIRVTGDNFVPNSSLKLFVNDSRLKSFVTDENGNFMLTTKIHKTTKAEQVNFVLKDKQENEKIINLYLTEIEQKISKNIDLTVSEIQNEFFRTERLEFSGTSNPDSLIIIKIKNPQGNLFSTKVQNTDFQGYWSTSIDIPFNAQIGKYSAEITDGKNILTKSWDVITSKKLNIFPTKLSFKFNELIKFNGTATPNEQINLILVGPQGNSVLSKNFVVNTSGFFEIEYPTTSSSLEGTYVLYAFQKYETQIISVGLDTYPKKVISTQLNYVNYHNSDVAIIGITGEASQDISLSIIDKNDHERFNDKIKLDFSGKRTYLLNLTTFPPGIYTVLVSMANFQASDKFTVDLQSSHVPIDFDMLKNTYYQGDSIYITGTSQPHSKIHLFLIDPDETIINEKETFTNKNGNLFSTSFLIPYGELFGK